MNSKVIFYSFPFLLGILCGIKINIVGEIYIGEIIALIFLLIRIKEIQITRFELSLLLLSFLWALAQFISDLVNETPFATMIKGVGTPIVFSLSILALIDYFKNNSARVPAFFLGASLGGLIYIIISNNEYFIGNPWKWGIGHFIAILFSIVFSYYLKRKSIVILVIFNIFFIVICLLFSSRTMAFFVLLSSFLYYQYSVNKNNNFVFLLTDAKFGFSIFCFFFVGLLFVLNSFFGAIFSSDDFLKYVPSEDAHKYQVQASGDYGILLGGRSELLISVKAFMDKPLLGHGSWAEDKSGYLDEYALLKYNLGYSLNDSDEYNGESNLIPTHSYIMGAVVWSGFLGGLIWIFILRFIIKSYARFYKDSSLFVSYLICLNVWNIFFSPFGADARWFTAMCLSTIYVSFYCESDC